MLLVFQMCEGPLCPWSYGSLICNYLRNQCLSPLMWVRIPIRARCTTLYDKVCQWRATGPWFTPGFPVSSTNKTDHHDMAEILLRVALNTIKPTNQIKYVDVCIQAFGTTFQYVRLCYPEFLIMYFIL